MYIWITSAFEVNVNSLDGFHKPPFKTTGSILINLRPKHPKFKGIQVENSIFFEQDCQYYHSFNEACFGGKHCFPCKRFGPWTSFFLYMNQIRKAIK